MLRLRITYLDAQELRRAADEEAARGALLVKVPPPEDLAFREVVSLELASPAGSLAIEAEVLSLLPGVGVAVAFPVARVAEVHALVEATPDGAGEAMHEIVRESAPPSARPPAPKNVVAEKIRRALHGTRDERAEILRDRDRSFHALVLKSPHVTPDEVATWARNPKMGAEFLKQIGDRKDWLSRPAIAQALARNPKTPPDVAVRALEHVGIETLRQMAKGAGVPPVVAAAARKKVVGK